MALPAEFYRNPADVLPRLRAEEKQKKTPCTGCAFLIQGHGLQVCDIHKRRYGPDMYRCGDYWRG